MKLGIVGNGQIVKEFLSVSNRIRHVDVIAICTRRHSEAEGKLLADQYKIPYVYTDYDEFLKEKAIDTVYVAITNDKHYEYAKKALQAHKNVIVEKPFTLNLKQGKELFRIAARKDRYVFEAITSLFSKGFKMMRENINKLGTIRMVEANFSQYSSRYDEFKMEIIQPAFDAERGGGALNDLNIYNLHITYALFGKPKEALYFGNVQKGVDTSGVAILRYPGFIAALVAAKDSFNDPYYNIQGEDAVLIQRTSANLCGPFEIEDKFQDIEYFDGEEYHTHRLENEFNEFERIMHTEDLSAYDTLREQTLGVLELLDELRENAEN